jgi:hypothetical protein
MDLWHKFLIESKSELNIDLLGTPDTNRKGLNTRKALNAFTSMPSWEICETAVLTSLYTNKNV